MPSIALMSQTIKEWLGENDKKLNCFAVCSDKKVGKSQEDFKSHDLPFTATTDVEHLKRQIARAETNSKSGSNVIFSTYQSIQVLVDAQKKGVIPKIRLTICDEAHRTTGISAP